MVGWVMSCSSVRRGRCTSCLRSKWTVAHSGRRLTTSNCAWLRASRPSSRNVSTIDVGDPAKRPVRPAFPPNAPVFVRSQPGPDEGFEIHGGRLRVIAVEFYDSVVAVRWRASPEPDIALAFPQETAAPEQDLAGLEDWAADDLRTKGRQKLTMMRLYRRFDLTDDLGTTSTPKGSSHGGGGGEMAGEAKFQPAVPPTTLELTFSWLGLEHSGGGTGYRRHPRVRFPAATNGRR
jgi:hypothetical protein